MLCIFITVDNGMRYVAARLLGTRMEARHLALVGAMVQAGLLPEAAILEEAFVHLRALVDQTGHK